MACHRATLCVVLIVAVSCVGASAASAAQRFFNSPSGNINCEMDAGVSGLGSRVYCQTLAPPKHVTLSAGGAITRCVGVQCLGNAPAGSPTLAFGRAVVLGPFRCTSARVGMTCTIVRTGRGFRIARDRTVVVPGM